MRMEEVKDSLYDVAAMFFQAAAVIWAEQANTKPPLPYVTLKTGTVGRTRFPIVDEDGRRYYPCSTVMEINLYTKGKPAARGDHATGSHINTAASDMNDFFSFVESDEITDLLAGKGIGISLVPPVRDLTSLQNDSSYRYRAMAEAEVSFVQEADGLYGVGNMPDIPNYSGGGTVKMQAEEISSIEKVKIQYGKEEEE